VSTEISASNGQRMLAMNVFSHALSFFRSRALLEINDQSGAKVASDDIRWIVTVPAIWHDPAKQLMRRAAYQVRTFASAGLYARTSAQLGGIKTINPLSVSLLGN